MFFFFSTTQSELITEISNGAGIQPIKAIKNAISTLLSGSIWLKLTGSVLLITAKLTANTVVMVNTIIITFIRLSNNLYFPTMSRIKQIIIIITVHSSILIKSPNRDEAKPAVTMVTAV